MLTDRAEPDLAPVQFKGLERQTPATRFAGASRTRPKGHTFHLFIITRQFIREGFRVRGRRRRSASIGRRFSSRFANCGNLKSKNIVQVDEFAGHRYSGDGRSP